MLLTSDYIRVQAGSSKEPFLGWRHFVYELNQFLNKNIVKGHQNLEYATLGHDDYRMSPNQATIKVFTGEELPLEYDPDKLISGTEYFLGEHGLEIIESHLDSDSWTVLVSGLSRYSRPESYQNIKNTWMKHALMSGTIIDIRQVGVEVEPGVFKLNHFIPSTQYVDPEEERFIFSIGKDKNSGDILAAYDTRFYGDDDYETLYLH